MDCTPRAEESEMKDRRLAMRPPTGWSAIVAALVLVPVSSAGVFSVEGVQGTLQGFGPGDQATGADGVEDGHPYLHLRNSVDDCELRGTGVAVGVVCFERGHVQPRDHRASVTIMDDVNVGPVSGLYCQGLVFEPSTPALCLNEGLGGSFRAGICSQFTLREGVNWAGGDVCGTGFSGGVVGVVAYDP